MEEIKSSLSGLVAAVKTLGDKIDKQEERLIRLENESITRNYAEPALNVDGLPSQTLPPAPPAPPVQEDSWEDLSESEHNNLQSISSVKEDNLEESIGGKWFAKIGITAIVLGVSFFLKYAFDNNWIGETGRVSIGILAGLALLGLGEKTIRKYAVYGRIITGGGIAILYLSVFAAFDFYHLITQIPAFICMALITAIGIALSLRYDAISLIMVAVLGGFLTPFLISTGENNQFGLFSYILILDLAVLAVSYFKKWRWLNLVGFLGTIIIFIGWVVEFYTKAQLFPTMFFLTLFFIVYSISSLVYNLVKKEKSSGIEQLLTLASAVIYFASSYAFLNSDYHPFMGFFALILAIYYFLWAYLTKVITAEDENLYNFLAFLTVGFITLAIPIQFEQNIITIGWIIEAVLLVVLGVKAKKESIISFGVVVFAMASVRLLTLDAGMRIDNNLFMINKTFFTFLVAILAAYLMAYLSRNYEESGSFIKKGSLVVLFVIAANFFTIFAISREIVVYYDNQRKEIYAEQSRATEQMRKYGRKNSGSYYQSIEYKASQSKMTKLKNKSSVTLSIFWLVYGIILMAGGIFGKNRGVRIGGMLLLILSILKLFFYDLWNLGTLYRIISSISLGVVLLAISFAYQKYKDKIKEII